MNKKVNTVLFILVGTIVNVILAIFCVLVLLFGLGRIGVAFGPKIAMLIPVCVIIGIIISMIIYQRLSGWVIEKFNFQDKLDPLFTMRHKKKSQNE